MLVPYRYPIEVRQRVYSSEESLQGRGHLRGTCEAIYNAQRPSSPGRFTDSGATGCWAAPRATYPLFHLHTGLLDQS